jgi:hypothetical protein
MQRRQLRDSGCMLAGDREQCEPGGFDGIENLSGVRVEL